MFLLPVFLQTLMGYDAIKAGLLMFPQGLMAGVMMVSSGILFRKLDPRIPMILGLGLVGVGLIAQSHITLDSSTWDVVWPTMLRGMGMGLAFPALNQTALAAIPIQRVGQASGLFNVTRQLGGSIGIAMMTAFLTTRTVFHQGLLGEAAAGNGVATQTIGQVAHDLISQGANPLVASQQAGAIVMGHLSQHIAVSAYQDTFFVAGLVMFAGLIPVLFMKRTPHTAADDASHMAVME
jgi:DHA2 family multidrug resistance protein